MMRRKNTGKILRILNNCTLVVSRRGLRARGLGGVFGLLLTIAFLLLAGGSLRSLFGM